MSNVAALKQQLAPRAPRQMSPEVAQVRSGINLMVEAMKSLMKKDIHFGIIPGVDKPSLFKAGAEKVMAIFRLSADPMVEDLSKDGEIRFRVKVNIKSADGVFVGAGIGECSSGEEKYSWRAAVCAEEFEVTPEDRRRIKFKKDKYSKEGYTKATQVRCVPSDLANTILKMAKKRALVDGVLTATGASDIFAQDIEDLPEEYVASVVSSHAPKAPEKAQESVVVAQQPAPIQENTPKPVSQPVQTTPPDDWDALAAAQNEAEPSQGSTPSLFHAEIGSEVLEWSGMVVASKTRTQNRKSDGKAFTITEYLVEDENGTQFKVSKFGDTQVDSGAIVTFFAIKVTEFKGNKQFSAKDLKIQ